MPSELCFARNRGRIWFSLTSFFLEKKKLGDDASPLSENQAAPKHLQSAPSSKLSYKTLVWISRWAFPCSRALSCHLLVKSSSFLPSLKVYNFYNKMYPLWVLFIEGHKTTQRPLPLESLCDCLPPESLFLCPGAEKGFLTLSSHIILFF